MLTGVFRASYAFVFEPQVPRDGGEPKFQVTMLIPKSDTATYQAIQAEVNRALQEGVPKVFGGLMPARPELPLYDGDGAKKNGEHFGEECRGCWVIRASSKTRPSVVDLNVQPIIDPNAFYSGCYARATINFFAYNKNGNRGVGCGLNNIQKIADGEPLSGRTTAEEDFGGRNAWNGPSTYGMQFQPSPQQGPNSAGGYGQGVYSSGNVSTGPYSSVALYPAAGQAQGGAGAAVGMTDPVTGMPLGGRVMGI
ncbi:MAG: DUF2815 family protein [Hungatella sp.]|jgi:hypothetical protein|nr:DUF2815 family protein [Hungatella sp.]